MERDILATVLLTATIQSLFGVGVLLFGTPILLLLGYGSLNTLSILLPISPPLTFCGSTRTIDTFTSPSTGGSSPFVFPA